MFGRVIQKLFTIIQLGYMQISPKVMEEDVASIHEQQKAIGYESTFVQW